MKLILIICIGSCFFEYISEATEPMQSHSTGIRNLKFDEYKQIKVLFPSLPEQKHLVEILDEAFAAITKAKANTEKNLQNAKELFESYLQNVFEEKIRANKITEECMEDVCSVLTCGVASTPKYVDENVWHFPFLSAQNVRDGRSILDKYRFIRKNSMIKEHRLSLVCFLVSLSWNSFEINRYLSRTTSPSSHFEQIKTECQHSRQHI